MECVRRRLKQDSGRSSDRSGVLAVASSAVAAAGSKTATTALTGLLPLSKQ